MKLRKIPNGETLRPATTLPLELQELLSARGKTDRTLKHPNSKSVITNTDDNIVYSWHFNYSTC
jgi:hypothetical protein